MGKNIRKWNQGVEYEDESGYLHRTLRVVKGPANINIHKRFQQVTDLNYISSSDNYKMIRSTIFIPSYVSHTIKSCTCTII
jgi:hypothetical protein